MADGSVVIEANLDVSKADIELAKLKKEIQKTESLVWKQEAKKAPLVAQAVELEKKMRAAREEAQRYRQDWMNGVVGADKSQVAAQERLFAAEAEYAKVVEQIDKIDAKLAPSYEKLDAMKTTAGQLQKNIDDAADSTGKLKTATETAGKSMDKFTKRLIGLAKRVFVFTVITKALSSLRDWLVNVIKTNGEATAAIARFKGALLTLVQPIVEKVIPVFTEFVDLATALISKITQIVLPIFGISVKDASESAKALYEEQQALEGVASSAKAAKGALAGFDEINKLSSNDTSEAIIPDFSSVTNTSWIDSVLAGVSEKVTTAMLLGGVALIAIGAALGSLGLVISGLALVGAGVATGDKNGTFDHWAQALGLDAVSGYVATALLLGGIALVAIGAATKNILALFAGLGLLGIGALYSEGNEKVEGWVKSLGLDSVNQFISTAILLGGIALVALGAIFGKIGMVLAGLGLVGASVAYSDESTKKSWADALGLNSVFDYVTAAIQLAGIALIAIGARLGSLALVIAGGVILGLGIAADAIGEETLAAWWDVLKLTTVQQWVGVALTLVGIALIAIGACMGNFVMIAAGALSLGVGTITNASEGNLKSWVTTLGLEKVAGWVTAALLLVGIALIVFGIFTANIMMVIAGAGMLGAGISVGVTSGTFSNWIDAILKALTDFKNKALEIINEVWEGFTGLFGDIKKYNPNFTGYGPDYSWMFSGSVSAPGLATGAVVPPNREFLAVLGDNKTETEVVSPLSTIEQAVENALQRSSTGGRGEINLVLTGELSALARVLRPYIQDENRRVGVNLITK